MGDREQQFKQLLELISAERLRPTTRGKENILVETESDKARVINSAAFRRLQQKAQVFPLDTNAAVRTRLTHSIEVSQVGRFIAQKVIEKFDVSHFSYQQLAAFANMVETACLLHDIGNPPFGHFGEAAIRDWALNDAKEYGYEGDLVEYDGNPQGFRLMSYLSGRDEYGLNLTSSLLLSTVKYPWTIENKPETAKKIGLFSSDYAVYQQACEITNWKPGVKFPFVRLMEAADDIAYSMSDLEDGLEKRIISIRDLADEFGADLLNPSINTAIDPFVRFKTNVIRKTVEEAAGIFVSNIDAILAGHDIGLVEKENPAGALVSQVKKYARKTIYSDVAAERVELAGRSVINGLLGHFSALLSVSETGFQQLIDTDGFGYSGRDLDFEIRLLRRLPQSYREKYLDVKREGEQARRAHLIVDFVSGMTDGFSLETYQVLEGIRIQ